MGQAFPLLEVRLALGRYGDLMRYEPVLSDFDGTLADSEPVILGAIHAACEELNTPVLPGSDLRACIGPPLERSFPEVFGPDAPIDGLIQAYRRHYMRAAPTETRLMPGAREALETWTAEGIRVGIVSYKPLPFIEKILEGMGLTGYLSVLRAPNVGEPPSSKTALLQQALDQLKPFQGAPVFIGDHPDDQRAAAEVKVKFIPYPENSWSDIRSLLSTP